MLNTLRARCPMVEVVLAPAAVQGDGAPAQIAEALAALNLHIRPDVIIVGRGGGSLEDLWAFNDERVVRAVAGSQAPVISGVGHETDFTLTDFAVDLRAPTPTGASVMAVPDRMDLKVELDSFQLRLSQDVIDTIEKNRYDLRGFTHRLDQASPRWQVIQDMQRLDELSLRITSAMRNILRSESAHVLSLEARLKTLDPRQVLNRGYALVRNIGGELITSLEQVKLDSDIDVRLKDGSFGARVTKKTKNG
jgi:exodeoxyribonuclease VII large subunit